MTLLKPIHLLPLVLVTACSSPQHPPPILDGSISSWQVNEEQYRNFDVPQLEPIPSPQVDGSVVFGIRAGEQSPINGVVLNNIAVAQLEVRYRTIQEQCRVERTSDLRLFGARALADIDHLRESIRANEARYQIILSERNDEISRLRSSLSTSNNLIWLGLGAGAGLLLLGGGILLAQ